MAEEKSIEPEKSDPQTKQSDAKQNIDIEEEGKVLMGIFLANLNENTKRDDPE